MFVYGVVMLVKMRNPRQVINIKIKMVGIRLKVLSFDWRTRLRKISNTGKNI